MRRMQGHRRSKTETRWQRVVAAARTCLPVSQSEELLCVDEYDRLELADLVRGLRADPVASRSVLEGGKLPFQPRHLGDVQGLQLLERVQDFLRELCTVAITLQFGNDSPLSRDVALAQGDVAFCLFELFLDAAAVHGKTCVFHCLPPSTGELLELDQGADRPGIPQVGFSCQH
jgi:hypothetical protein